MHFLIDANMPRSTASLLGVYGHLSTDVRDIGMGRTLTSRLLATQRTTDFAS